MYLLYYNYYIMLFLMDAEKGENKMKKYLITIYTDDCIPWSHTYICDENTLETTLRVAKETKYMTSIEIKEME